MADGKWEKGQSGNPAGGKKRRDTAAVVFRKLLEAINQEIAEIEARPDVTQLQLIGIAYVKKAKDGDFKSGQTLLDRAYGKPAEAKEDSEQGGSLTIILPDVNNLDADNSGGSST